MGYQEFIDVAPYIVGGLSFILLCNTVLAKYLEKRFPDTPQKPSLEKSLSE